MNYRIIHHCSGKQLALFLNIIQYFVNDRNFCFFNVSSYATDFEHGITVPVSGYHLKKVKHRFTVFPCPHENSIITQEMSCKSNPEQMAVYTLELTDY